MSVAEIIWEAPSAKATGRTNGTRTREFVAAIKARPGEWAKFPERMSVAFGRGLKLRFGPAIEYASRENATDENGKKTCVWFVRWQASA